MTSASVDRSVTIKKHSNEAGWLFCLLFFAVALIYAPTLQYEAFVLDDALYVFQNPAVTRADGLGIIWTSWHLPAGATNWPLVFTSFWFEYRWFGSRSNGYHGTNVLLHLATAWCLGLWLRRLLGRPWLAWTTALLFAVHPLQVSSVAWIAERKNVLCGFFTFLCLYCFTCWRQPDTEKVTSSRNSGLRGTWLGYYCYILTLAAALASKSSAVAVLPIACLCDYYLFGRSRSWEFVKTQWLAGLLVLFSCAMTLFAEKHVTVEPTIGERLVLLPAIQLFYLEKIVFPADLQFFYPPWKVEPTRWNWWLAALFFYTIFCFLLYGSIRKRLTGWLVLGLMVFEFFLLPVSGLVSFGWYQFTYVSDHLVYLALAGIVLLIAGVLTWLHDSKQWGQRCAYLLLLLLLVTWSWQSISEVKRWQNSETLLAPVSLTTHSLNAVLTKALWFSADPNTAAAAADLLQQIQKKYPDHYKAYYIEAELQWNLGQAPRAIQLARQALALAPQILDCRIRLANYLIQTGQFAEARTSYHEIVKSNPRADLLAALAHIYYQMGEPQSAVNWYQQAHQADPTVAEHLFNLGVVLWQTGQPEAARAAWQKCLTVQPNHAEARQALWKSAPAQSNDQ